MSYHVNRRWGHSDANASVQQMREALAELDVEDPEHPDVALIHENGWCLGAYPSGRSSGRTSPTMLVGLGTCVACHGSVFSNCGNSCHEVS